MVENNRIINIKQTITVMYRIVSKDMLTPTICRMRVEAPRLAAAALPGQFLIIRADEQGERVPLTISDFDKEAGTVTIVTQKIGASTTEICTYEEGDSFSDVVGPLGIPSDFTEMTAEKLAGKRYRYERSTRGLSLEAELAPGLGLPKWPLLALTSGKFL